jgi:hypothetical protein
VQQRGLTVFENRVLRRISGPKRQDVTEIWRKFYNQGLHSFHCSPNIIGMSKLRWNARVGEKTNAYNVLVCELEGRRPL